MPPYIQVRERERGGSLGDRREGEGSFGAWVWKAPEAHRAWTGTFGSTKLKLLWADGPMGR